MSDKTAKPAMPKGDLTGKQVNKYGFYLFTSSLAAMIPVSYTHLIQEVEICQGMCHNNLFFRFGDTVIDNIDLA